MSVSDDSISALFPDLRLFTFWSRDYPLTDDPYRQPVPVSPPSIWHSFASSWTRRREKCNTTNVGANSEKHVISVVAAKSVATSWTDLRGLARSVKNQAWNAGKSRVPRLRDHERACVDVK
jgi:hypothetical protein